MAPKVYLIGVMKNVLLILVLFAQVLFAQEIERSTATSITIDSERLFLVTHASSMFDQNAVAKNGVGEMLDARQPDDRLVFVMNEDEQNDQQWYTEVRDPDLAIHSINGSHDISFTGSEVFLGGGYFTLCFDRALKDIVRTRPQNLHADELQVNLMLDGIYEDKYFLLADKDNPCFTYDRWSPMPITRTLWTFITEFSEQYTLAVISDFLQESLQTNTTTIFYKDRLLRSWRGSSRQQRIRVNLIPAQ